MKPIFNEFSTVMALLNGASIARFGDGELRLALGVSVGHQEAKPDLVGELNHILKHPTKCLVGIPYVSKDSPKKETWEKYGTKKYTSLYNPEKQYHSAFITRPDSAPWIDTQDYWDAVEELWSGKDIIIVSGSPKGFRPEEMRAAKSIKFIQTFAEQAYLDIDRIEKEIGHDAGKVILLAAGATATVLAYRLSEKGFQALDLGHAPMFMRRRGFFNA